MSRVRAAALVSGVAVVVTAAALVALPGGESHGAVAAAAGPQAVAARSDDPTGGAAIEWDGLVVDDYAHEDEPWAQQYFAELGQVPFRSDFFLGQRPRPFEGQFVNVVDGRRATYTPEEPELTVWFFGGSTMFSIGQRDDHTLPSVIAQLAARDGIRIRAINFGVPGFVNWQSLEQFEQALPSDMARPDLAVFYEGLNDSALGSERADLGDVRRGTISRLARSEDERQRVRDTFGDVGPLPYDPERIELEMDLAADQYGRGAELIDHLAASYGVPVTRFWQPSPFAKRPQPSDDRLWERLDYEPQFLDESTRRYNEVRERSGVDTIDLTAVLDDVDRPVYFDGGHTNELGARIVGEAMYEDLRPQLLDLARS